MPVLLEDLDLYKNLMLLYNFLLNTNFKLRIVTYALHYTLQFSLICNDLARYILNIKNFTPL